MRQLVIGGIAAALVLAAAAPASAQWVYTKTYSSGNLTTAIPDGGNATIPMTITEAGRVADLNVRVRITHPRDNDLSLGLGFSTPGSSFGSSLAHRAGGEGDDYGSGNADCSGTPTVFDDDSSTPIASGVAPFTATSYAPEVSFGAYSVLRADWRFSASDVVAGNTGTINCFELQITREKDIVVRNDAGQPGAVVAYFAPRRLNATTPLCSPASGSFFPIGPTTVTCTARRLSFPFDTDSEAFVVTVEDREDPTITAPPNQTRSNDPNQAGAVVNFPPPSASDNAPEVMVVCSPASGSFFPLGTTTVTCTATDASGNTASDSFTVTVNDTQAPTITPPPDQTVNNDPGQASARVTYPPPTASDNAPGVSASCTLPSGALFPLGTTTVTCTARDAANNTTSRTFTVTVRDAEPPRISPRPLAPLGNQLGRVGAVVGYPDPEISDNAPGVTHACSPPSGSFFPIGTTTVSCTATDAAGNTASASFPVAVTLVRCSLLGNRRANRLNGTAGRDWICGGAGNDRIAARAGDDLVDGGAGNDMLAGGAGRDDLRGGAGNDIVNARRGGNDRVRCGRGRDTVLANRRDRVARDCEMVRRT
jgi:subtilisin-like proprotein convertase family protein